MDTSQERIDTLIAAPSESLNVELKRWIDPTTARGIAKIAIGCIALRNRNGGFLVIGIDDTTMLPDENRPEGDVTQLFHPDRIQQIVSQFASTLFEVKVRFAQRDGLLFPVIAVDEGVRIPVAAKRELLDAGKHLIRQDAVYFRTLKANGVVSSSAATHGDWTDILDVCFENREADIGRFLRRHLGPHTPMLEELGQPKKQNTPLQRAQTALLTGDRKRIAALDSEEFRGSAQRYKELGAWTVALAFDPPLSATDTDRSFMRTIGWANPQYTGWPVWLDAASMPAEYQPRKKAGGWETVILNRDNFVAEHAEFQWVHAKGEFYLWRVYQDDLTEKVEPGTALDFGLLIYRFAEAIAVGLAFAKALNIADAELCFAFRADKLSGRVARGWANPERYLPVRGKAYDDAVEGYTVLPADTAVSAIAPYVQQAVAPIAGAFGGPELSAEMVEPFVQRLVSRRM